MSKKESKFTFEKTRKITITKKTAPWAPKEELGEYTLNRWSWYNREKALAESMMIIDEDRGISRVIMEEFYARMVLFCTTPPEALQSNWKLERVKQLDSQVGVKLKTEIRELNGLDWGEKAGFLERSDQEKDIPG